MLSALVAVGAYVALRDGRQEAVLPPDAPSAAGSATGDGDGSQGAATDPEGARADAASALLVRLQAALRSRAPEAAVAAVDLAAPGDPDARRELRTLWSNVRRLRVVGLSLRYVDEAPERAPASAGAGAWVADVEVRWRLAGYDRREARVETAVTVASTGGGAAYVTARGGHGGATPLWLLGRVRVDRGPRALVLTAPGQRPGRFAGLADRAVRDVRRVLPGWRGRLVVEVPSGQRELGRVLGAEDGAYDEIAAVTTTVDGTSTAGAPTHVFVNPRVFDPLGPNGSRIVMSHEATHVATGAATSSMPTWLLEGFADYVALAHAGLPPSVAASQVLRRVRDDGAPRHLPGAHEFDPRNTALGASYESAWLACRLLAETYGERRLVAFYRAADRASRPGAGGGAVAPFADLGTTRRAFTRAWRASLERLAG